MKIDLWIVMKFLMLEFLWPLRDFQTFIAMFYSMILMFIILYFTGHVFFSWCLLQNAYEILSLFCSHFNLKTGKENNLCHDEVQVPWTFNCRKTLKMNDCGK